MRPGVARVLEGASTGALALTSVPVFVLDVPPSTGVLVFTTGFGLLEDDVLVLLDEPASPTGALAWTSVPVFVLDVPPSTGVLVFTTGFGLLEDDVLLDELASPTGASALTSVPVFVLDVPPSTGVLVFTTGFGLLEDDVLLDELASPTGALALTSVPVFVLDVPPSTGVLVFTTGFGLLEDDVLLDELASPTGALALTSVPVLGFVCGCQYSFRTAVGPRDPVRDRYPGEGCRWSTRNRGSRSEPRARTPRASAGSSRLVGRTVPVGTPPDPGEGERPLPASLPARIRLRRRRDVGSCGALGIPPTDELEGSVPAAPLEASSRLRSRPAAAKVAAEDDPEGDKALAATELVRPVAVGTSATDWLPG